MSLDGIINKREYKPRFSEAYVMSITVVAHTLIQHKCEIPHL